MYSKVPDQTIQQAQKVETTSIQRWSKRLDVKSTLNRRYFNVVCYNIELMSIQNCTLKQRRFKTNSISRRWINVESTLLQRFVPAGYMISLGGIDSFSHEAANAHVFNFVFIV